MSRGLQVSFCITFSRTSSFRFLTWKFDWTLNSTQVSIYLNKKLPLNQFLPLQLPEIFFKNIYFLLYKVNWNERMICFPLKNIGLLTSAYKTNNRYFMPSWFIKQMKLPSFFEPYFFLFWWILSFGLCICFSLLIAFARQFCSMQILNTSLAAIL